MKKTKRLFGIFSLAVFILLILYLYMNFISFNVTLQFFLFDIDESQVLKFIDILSRNYENGNSFPAVLFILALLLPLIGSVIFLIPSLSNKVVKRKSFSIISTFTVFGTISLTLISTISGFRGSSSPSESTEMIARLENLGGNIDINLGIGFWLVLITLIIYIIGLILSLKKTNQIK